MSVRDDSTTAVTESLAAKFHDVPWVVRVTETDRSDASHELITEKSVLRMDYEIHTIENLGVEIRAISQAGHYGCRVYVRYTG